MKMKMAIVALTALGLVGFMAGAANAEDKLGLLIIAHGSPSPTWNQPVLDLERKVSELMQTEHPGLFSSIRVALMEFVEPSIATVISELEDDGINRVYALPLFVAPSGHSLYDVPAILGLYAEKGIMEELEEEGIELVDSDLKISLGPTIDAEVVKSIMLDRVMEMSEDPDSEAIVILAHGDRYFEPIWISLVSEVGTGLCAKSGINYFDYGFIGMGQAFMSEGAHAIFRTLDKYDRVLVLGLYMCSGVDKLVRRAIKRMAGDSTGDSDIFAGYDVRFADSGLLPDKRISEWIVEKAFEWVEFTKLAR